MKITYKHIRPTIKRTAYSHKLLISPYYGCSHECLFCPANNGFLKKSVFDNYNKKKELYVVDNVLEHIESNLHPEIDDVKTLHLSPVSDPFQPAEAIFEMSRKVVEYCIEKKLNLAICTKGVIPDSIIPLLREINHVVVQVSMYTPHEHIRKILVKGNAATTTELIHNLEITRLPNIQRVLRVDPIFPYITDSMEDFKHLVDLGVKNQVSCILSSVADIVPGNLDKEAEYLERIQDGLYNKYKALYTNEINGRLHANIEYRLTIFGLMREICHAANIPFGITWEPDENGNSLSGVYSDQLISKFID